MNEEAVQKEVIRWVTKDALSVGDVEALWGEVVGPNFKIDMFGAGLYYGPGHYHENYQDAILKARQMRDKKIASLRAQIKKLEGMFV